MKKSFEERTFGKLAEGRFRKVVGCSAFAAEKCS